MAGQLKKYPLTELIREISAGGLSGALRLARERAKSVVYFDAGEIIYAASNLRAYRLVESVRRWNILSEEQLARLQGITSDLEFGTALVETRTLSQEQLKELMARQVSELLCHTLLWTEGDWDFDSRVRLAADTRAVVKTKQLLVESARRLPAEFVWARFANKSEQLFPEAQTSDDINLLPTEAFVLTRVDSSLTINELLAIAGLPEAETLHAVYTLALGGFLRRERWPQALTAEELAKARAAKAAQVKQETPPPATVAEPKVESKTEAKAAASEQTTPAAPTTTPEEPRDEQAELEAFFKRLNIATDHYQELGVRRSANLAEIKRAYYALAKRFHPDRFRRESDAARLASIESAFAQVAQAYETLKDNGSRAVYDSRLLKQEQEERAGRAAAAARSHAAKKPEQERAEVSNDFSFPKAGSQSASATYAAEERFQQGLSALHQGNHAFAIAALGEAARLEPNEPRYRAYFGQALASDQRLRRNAEAELKAAVALDANNASYRLMLAELYSKIGLLKRAQSELDRVLAAEPRNDAARQLRDKLKRG
jgi:curved DNA-binding protein CbpA